MRVRTRYGKIEGTVHREIKTQGTVARFRAVPYAAPPFGARRLRPPQPPQPWDGVRDCTRPGPGAPQPWQPDDPWDRCVNPQQQGEDCLTLEIRTPEPGPAALPVMVWIHGGGFVTGVGSAPAYPGETFARDGIVHVTINYRLGLDGYCHIADGADNLGLRDQIAALQWVADNIAAFGGDPANVTIAGQSAGAIGVAYLLAAPAARGLFRRAISQSGMPNATVPVDMARRVTERTASILGVEPARAGLAAVSLADTRRVTWQLMAESAQPAGWADTFYPALPYLGVHGTEMLPQPVLEALAGGISQDVALLAGTTKDEATGIIRKMGLPEPLDPDWLAPILAALNVNERTLAAYRTGTDRAASATRVLTAVLTDWSFRIPTIRLVEAHRGSSYLYRFDWESPALPAGMGADHTLDVPFVYDDLAGFAGHGAVMREFLGPNPPQSLADAMHRAWVDFVSTGNAGWPVYRPNRRMTMRFATDSRPVEDLAGAQRMAWQGTL